MATIFEISALFAVLKPQPLNSFESGLPQRRSRALPPAEPGRTLIGGSLETLLQKQDVAYNLLNQYISLGDVADAKPVL
jgi:hypothetical protein